MSRAGCDPPGVIVFDGMCVLCSGWVRFLLRRDYCGVFRFASMQGEAGRALLAAHGLNADDPVSFLVVRDGRAWTDSDALVAVLSGLGGTWRLAARVVAAIPPAWRDRAYRLVARNRYRWFGRRTRCLLPDPAQRARFLDGMPASEAPPLRPAVD